MPTDQWMKSLKRKFNPQVRAYTNMLHEIIDEENQKRAKYNNNKDNEDTNLRKEIHKRIKDQINEGRTILEIVQDLNSENRYQKYGMYFESWIMDAFNKYNKAQNDFKKEDLEK